MANVLFDTAPIMFFLNIFIYNINCLSYYLSLNSFHVLTSIDLNWFTDRFIYWPIHLFEYIFSCLCVDSLIHLSIEFFTIPYAHICICICIYTDPYLAPHQKPSISRQTMTDRSRSGFQFAPDRLFVHLASAGVGDLSPNLVLGILEPKNLPSQPGRWGSLYRLC